MTTKAPPTHLHDGHVPPRWPWPTLVSRDPSFRPATTVLRPHLFLVIDRSQPLSPGQRFALDGIDELSVGRSAEGRGATVTSDGRACLILELDDAWVSQQHLTLRRAGGRWEFEDGGSRNGTFRNGVRELRGILADGDVLEVGHTFFLFRAGLEVDVDLEAGAAERDGGCPNPDDEQPALIGLRTLVPPLTRALGRLRRIAGTGVSTVIYGQSGTGKELLARAMHALSGRTGPFVAANCGALPETLVHSELFGHRRGAFSGAGDDRPGLIRSADRGTLFLDEIGDLSPAGQVAILRVLQEHEVVPVGSHKPVAVDVRVLSATHRDLDELVRAGKFRSDLLARISGFVVKLPPLRDRREDMGLFVAELLQRHFGPQAAGISFSREAMNAILRYEWPLNVRELENALRSAVALAAEGVVRPEHLPEALCRQPQRPEARGGRPLSEADAALRTQLTALLEEHGANISAVARAMKKDRVQIHRWLKRLALDPAAYRR